MNVAVIIATYGAEHWRQLALSRAYPSALDQGAHEIVVGHDSRTSPWPIFGDGGIAQVRNALAEKSTGDWLCFLDADDQFAPGYLDAMKRALEQGGRLDGVPPLLTPALRYVVQRHRQPAHFQAEQDLREGNWLTIGTLIARKLFFEVGGFREWGLYEDWDLWARCGMAGAQIVKVPDAVYLAHYSSTSRNRTARRGERNYWHQIIGHDLWPDYYDSPSQTEHASRQVAGVRKFGLSWSS